MAVTLPTFGATEAPRQTVSPVSTPTFIPSQGQGQPQAQPSQADSIIAQLLSQIQAPAQKNGTATMASVLGSAANNEQANRNTRGNFTQDHDTLMLNAQTGRNQNEGDALKKLAITNYLRSGGFHASPATLSINGQSRQLPSFGSAPRPSSAAQQASGGTLEDMLTKRLASGGSYLPADVNSYANPGGLEKTLGYGSEIVGGLGAVNQMMQKPDGHGGTTGGIPYGQIAGSVMNYLSNRKK